MAKAGLSKSFQAALARPVLQRVATTPVFQQGQQFFHEGRVSRVECEADEAAGEVRDDETYLARLWMDDGFLQFECACARGRESLLCAHGVAVGLAAMAPPSKGRGKPKVKVVDLAETDRVLREQPVETLVGLLMNWAREDERLQQHLMNFAAEQAGMSLDVKEMVAGLRRRLRRMPAAARPVEAKRYSELVKRELEELETMLLRGHAAAVVEMAGELVRLIYLHQDHNLSVKVIFEHAPPAVALLVKAARAAKSEPMAVIRQVLSWDLHPDVDKLDLTAVYEWLGPSGRRQLAEEAESRVEHVHPDWRKRAVHVRLLAFACRYYISVKEPESYVRAVLRYARGRPLDALLQVRGLMYAGYPRETLALINMLTEGASKSDTSHYEWLRVKAEQALSAG